MIDFKACFNGYDSRWRDFIDKYKNFIRAR